MLGRTLSAALFLMLACQSPAPQTPVETYLGFLKDLRAGDEAAAYALLSQPTRSALDARAQAVAKASGGTVKPDATAMVFGAPPPPPSSVALVREDAQQALLQVGEADGGTQVHLVREAGAWRIDLTSSLR